MSATPTKRKHLEPFEGCTWTPTTPTQHTPLLFIHGATLDYRWWDDHFVLHFVQQGYTCYALSLRNHHARDGWLHWYFSRIQDYVADVARVVDLLPSPPILIGHSMGGYVVQKYLEHRAAPGAVLMAPVPSHGFYQIAARLIKMHIPGILRDALTLRRNILYPTPEQLRKICFSADFPEYMLREYHERLHLESIPALLDMLLFDRPRTAQIRGKTTMLVIGAALDKVIGTQEIVATAQAYDAEYSIIPNLTHNLIHEEGWQAVAERISTWLATHHQGNLSW